MIQKPGRTYLTSGKNNYTAAIIVFLVASLIGTVLSAGCGLFYQYPDEELERYSGTAGQKEAYTVSEVVDGDTVVLENGEHVRLLGINTPEEGMYFYQESKEVLQAIVLGKSVILESDISDLDLYSRKLRYIYLGDLFVNLEMVKRGFANIYTCPPDVKYAEDFLEAERYARGNNLGLWELSDIGTVKIGIIYDSLGNDNKNINGEYVILENTGDVMLDTAGWTVKDNGTNIYRFGSYNFYPGSRITLYSGRGRDSDGVFYWNSPKPVWNNDFDTLYLRDGEGLLMGIYNY